VRTWPSVAESALPASMSNVRSRWTTPAGQKLSPRTTLSAWRSRRRSTQMSSGAPEPSWTCSIRQGPNDGRNDPHPKAAPISAGSERRETRYVDHAERGKTGVRSLLAGRGDRRSHASGERVERDRNPALLMPPDTPVRKRSWNEGGIGRSTNVARSACRGLRATPRDVALHKISGRLSHRVPLDPLTV
jgi:hypothetical protein